MRKHYLVFHEKSWMKNELVPNKRTEPHCSFVFAQRDFKEAKYIETKEGTKIDENWILKNMASIEYLKAYDGLVIILDGEKLGGRHGLHTKKTYNNRRFSLIQMEAKKGWYREWKQRKDKTWWLDLTRRRSKETIKQIVYTFEHEIGHSLSWLHALTDTLHTFVRLKQWELWWESLQNVLPLNEPKKK